jgi:hypothetical protein
VGDAEEYLTARVLEADEEGIGGWDNLKLEEVVGLIMCRVREGPLRMF